MANFTNSFKDGRVVNAIIEYYTGAAVEAENMLHSGFSESIKHAVRLGILPSFCKLSRGFVVRIHSPAVSFLCRWRRAAQRTQDEHCHYGVFGQQSHQAKGGDPSCSEDPAPLAVNADEGSPGQEAFYRPRPSVGHSRLSRQVFDCGRNSGCSSWSLA